MVGEEGLEPSQVIHPKDFKSFASASSATRPFKSAEVPKFKSGGADRIRTGVRDFADRCLASRPPRLLFFSLSPYIYTTTRRLRGQETVKLP